ncbi:MAG: hypothetical protein OEY86_07500 [Nitrospira sp.]|nr:hypothetical protein [Nitrospira sp.]
MDSPAETELPELLTARYRVAYDIVHRLRAHGHDLEFVAAVGMLMSARCLRESAGCRWIFESKDTEDERFVSYNSRADVTQGRAHADHILSSDCVNAHQLAATVGRLGHFMEQVFDRIRTEKAKGLV